MKEILLLQHQKALLCLVPDQAADNLWAYCHDYMLQTSPPQTADGFLSYLNLRFPDQSALLLRIIPDNEETAKSYAAYPQFTF